MNVTSPIAEARLSRPSAARRLASNLFPSLWSALVAGSLVLLIGGLAVVGPITVLLVLFRSLDPPTSALMLGQRLSGMEVEQRWVPLQRIANPLIAAVIVSEDGAFCSHHGIDFRELEAAMEEAERSGEDVRGASTITMQVAKNLFLWPGKSYLRKGLEAGLALLIELVWPKRRILEVYLNIAEWGPGIFGAEAAAQYHFRKPAARLGEREAALLAVSLPNPIERDAGQPGPGTRRLADLIQRRMRLIGKRAQCAHVR
jgi:monofunctional glycosyltransferase